MSVFIGNKKLRNELIRLRLNRVMNWFINFDNHPLYMVKKIDKTNSVVDISEIIECIEKIKSEGYVITRLYLPTAFVIDNLPKTSSYYFDLINVPSYNSPNVIDVSKMSMDELGAKIIQYLALPISPIGIEYVDGNNELYLQLINPTDGNVVYNSLIDYYVFK